MPDTGTPEPQSDAEDSRQSEEITEPLREVLKRMPNTAAGPREALDDTMSVEDYQDLLNSLCEEY